PSHYIGHMHIYSCSCLFRILLKHLFLLCISISERFACIGFLWVLTLISQFLLDTISRIESEDIRSNAHILKTKGYKTYYFIVSIHILYKSILLHCICYSN
ncbi:hypothetical protein PAEPH01_2871, partial [Pancytospora epiphaga]